MYDLYSNMKLATLKDIAEARGIQCSERSSKGVYVDALRKADSEIVSGDRNDETHNTLIVLDASGQDTAELTSHHSCGISQTFEAQAQIAVNRNSTDLSLVATEKIGSRDVRQVESEEQVSSSSSVEGLGSQEASVEHDNPGGPILRPTVVNGEIGSSAAMSPSETSVEAQDSLSGRVLPDQRWVEQIQSLQHQVSALQAALATATAMVNSREPQPSAPTRVFDRRVAPLASSLPPSSSASSSSSSSSLSSQLPMFDDELMSDFPRDLHRAPVEDHVYDTRATDSLLAQLRDDDTVRRAIADSAGRSPEERVMLVGGCASTGGASEGPSRDRGLSALPRPRESSRPPFDNRSRTSADPRSFHRNEVIMPPRAGMDAPHSFSGRPAFVLTQPPSRVLDRHNGMAAEMLETMSFDFTTSVLASLDPRQSSGLPATSQPGHGAPRYLRPTAPALQGTQPGTRGAAGSEHGDEAEEGAEVPMTPHEQSLAAQLGVADEIRSVAAALHGGRTEASFEVAMSNPLVENRELHLRWVWLCGGGQWPNAFALDPQSSGVYVTLQRALSDLMVNRETYKLLFPVTKKLIERTVRTDFAKIHLEQFQSLDFKAVAALLNGYQMPADWVPSPSHQWSESRLRDVGDNITVWLALNYGAPVGTAWRDASRAILTRYRAETITLSEAVKWTHSMLVCLGERTAEETDAAVRTLKHNDMWKGMSQTVQSFLQVAHTPLPEGGTFLQRPEKSLILHVLHELERKQYILNGLRREKEQQWFDGATASVAPAPSAKTRGSGIIPSVAVMEPPPSPVPAARADSGTGRPSLTVNERRNAGRCLATLGLHNVCLAYNTVDGCGMGESCSRQHLRLPPQDLAGLGLPAQVFMAAFGGAFGTEPIPLSDRQGFVSRLRQEASALMTASARGTGSVPSWETRLPSFPADLMGAAASAHIKEQPLRHLACGDLEAPVVLPPTRREQPFLTDDEYTAHVRRVKVELGTFTSVIGSLDPELQALIHNLAARQRLDNSAASCAELLHRAAEALESSTIEGAAAAAAALRPPSTVARGGVLTATRDKGHDGLPLLVTYPSAPVVNGNPVLSEVHLAGLRFPVQDLGEMVGDFRGQCVLLCLAHISGLEQAAFVEMLRVEAVSLQRDLGPLGSSLTILEQQARLIAHDLVHNPHHSNGSHDVHLIRFVAQGLWRYRRLFVVTATGSEGSMEVHAVTGKDFDPTLPGHHTDAVLLVNGHARLLGPPRSWGGGTRKNVPMSRFSPAQATAFLSTMAQSGLLVRTFGPVTLDDILHGPHLIPTALLLPCACCAEPLNLALPTRGGRYPPHVRLLHDPVPADVSEWAERMQLLSGGFTGANLKAHGLRRSSDYQAFVGLSKSDIESYVLPIGVPALASDLVHTAFMLHQGCDKKAIKARDPSSLSFLARAIRAAVLKGDAVVTATGGVRMALVALRQAIYRTGRHTLDPSRVDCFRDLLDPAIFAAVKNTATFGATLLQGEEVSAGRRKPFDSAKSSAPELLLDALAGVGRGLSLLVSRRLSGDKLDESGAVFSPVGSTPKKDALGVPSLVRAITDLRALNAALAAQLPTALIPLRQPGAVCPTLAEFVRIIWYFAARYPGIPVDLFARDITHAYQRLFMAVADGPSQCTELPVDGLAELADLGVLVCVHSDGVFGGQSTPGVFGTLAWAVTAAAMALRPPEPEINGKGAAARSHVDDTMVVVPRLGNSGQYAEAAYDWAATMMFGDGAVSEEKKKASGPRGPRLTFTGRFFDLTGLVGGGLRACRILTPSVKWKKFLRLLMEMLQFVENRAVPMKKHEELVGLYNWISRPIPVHRALLSQLYVMSSPRGEWVSGVAAGASAKTRNDVWQCHEETLELVVIMAEDALESAERREAAEGRGVTVSADLQELGGDGNLGCSVLGALTLQEQLMAGRAASYVTTDAMIEPVLDDAGTPQMRDGQAVRRGAYGFGCHQLKVFTYGSLAGHSENLRQMVGTDDVNVIISVAEVLSVVVGSMPIAPTWKGQIKMVPIDNSNGEAGMKTFTSKHPCLRFLYGVLARMAAKYDFDYMSTWVASEHNEFGDGLSRVPAEWSREEVQAYVDTFAAGYTYYDSSACLNFILQQGVPSPTRSFMMWGEESNSLAARLAAARSRRGAAATATLASPVLPKGVTAVELFAGLGQFSRVARERGVTVLGFYEPDVALARFYQASSETAGVPRVVELDTDAIREVVGKASVDLVFVGPPPLDSRTWIAVVSRVVYALSPQVVVIELVPGQEERSGGLTAVDTSLGALDYERVMPQTGLGPLLNLPAELSLSFERGSACKRERLILHYEQTSKCAELGVLAALRNESIAKGGTSLRSILDPVGKVPKGTTVSAEFEPFQRRGSSTRPGMLGHVFLGARAEQNFEVGGRIRRKTCPGTWIVQTVTASGELVVRPEGGGRVRHTLKTDEVEAGIPRKIVVRSIDGPGAALRSFGHPPEGIGNNLIWDDRGEEVRVRSLSTSEVWRICGYPDEASDLFMAVNPRLRRHEVEQAPANGVLKVDAEAVVDRALGRVTQAMSLRPCEADARPGTRASGGKRRVIAPMADYDREALDPLRSARSTLILSSIGSNSLSTYGSSFKHWVMWRMVRGQPLYLTGRDLNADQNEMVSFVAYKGLVFNYGHGTVHVMLYAIRFQHLAAGMGDPLRDKPLLKVAMKGLKRIQGGPRRKIPASMDIIREAVVGLDQETWNGLMVTIALVMMFLFLMRSREALRKGATPDEQQCLRVGSVIMASHGKTVKGSEVATSDEVVVMWGRSKTDIDGQGSVANVFEADHPLCLVRLLKKAHAMRPHHFSREDSYFFVLDDGKVLHRDKVVDVLRRAAGKLGVPEEALSVISLRAGGASAMWHAGFTVDEIKRRGRWASECWRIYVWEGRERARNVATKMLSSVFSLMASLARHARV